MRRPSAPWSWKCAALSWCQWPESHFHLSHPVPGGLVPVTWLLDVLLRCLTSSHLRIFSISHYFLHLFRIFALHLFFPCEYSCPDSGKLWKCPLSTTLGLFVLCLCWSSPTVVKKTFFICALITSANWFGTSYFGGWVGTKQKVRVLGGGAVVSFCLCEIGIIHKATEGAFKLLVNTPSSLPTIKLQVEDYT